MILEARNKNIVRLLEEKGNIIENRHTGIATMRDEKGRVTWARISMFKRRF